MKKKFRKLAVGLAVAGTMAGMIPGLVAPVSAFADEAEDISDQGVSDSYKVNIINEYQYTEGSEADYPEVSKLVSDKETAAPGETVTITFVRASGGLPESRIKVIRSDSGEDVTESVLGEHHSHLNEDKLTFMMPEYDITIKAGIIVGPYESTPVFAFSDKADYRLASVRGSENGKVTVEAESLEKSVLDDTITVVENGDTVHLTAVPDPGYKFKKWYISCPFCNVGITDDMEINTKIDEVTGVATADFVQNGNVWIEAEFELELPGPGFGAALALNINYVDAQGKTITDSVRYDVLDANGNATDAFKAENNLFYQNYSFKPHKVPDGKINGRDVYKTVYETTSENNTNIIRTVSLPEGYKPVDDIKITSNVVDYNYNGFDYDKFDVALVVSSDSDKVTIEKGEDLNYNIFIPVASKENSTDNGETDITKKSEKELPEENKPTDDLISGAEKKNITADQSKKTPAVTTAGSSVSAAAVPVNTKTTAPVTGDEAHLLLYSITAGSSVVTAAALFVLYGRREKEK